MRHEDVAGRDLAIFEAGHSSSPLWKIASIFFDNTSSAAVSASAAFLRRRSRSSSLMRRRSCLVWLGLARASSGEANACVALSRQATRSCRNTPFARHHALLAASSMAAVVSTASNRATAVQARSRAGSANASLNQRLSVSTPMPISPATSSAAALSGGSMRATALSLNALPYLDTVVLHRRPRLWFYEGDNYCDAGGASTSRPTIVLQASRSGTAAASRSQVRR